jgi:hypothetical protein
MECNRHNQGKTKSKRNPLSPLITESIRDVVAQIVIKSYNVVRESLQSLRNYLRLLQQH